MIVTVQIFLAYASPISGFIGTALIFFFGVPRQIDTGGLSFIALEEEDEEEKKKITKYKFYGNMGLFLIALGFFCQIVYLLISGAV
jgi:hypothetical protein